MIETQPREIARGKTKVIMRESEFDDEGEFLNLEDLTAGDGAKKAWFPMKGVYSTQTNHFAMRLIEEAGIPVAYRCRSGLDKFRALIVDMLPYEIVALRLATAKSSFLKRNPGFQAGHVFEEVETALFLKTTDYEYRGIRFEKNDPFVAAEGTEGVLVCRPDMPVGEGNTLTHIPSSMLFGDGPVHPFEELHEIVKRVFLVLEKAWKRDGCTLCDLKIECGYTRGGHLVVADVIDNDSWRLLSQFGVHLDKQPFRDGDTPLEVIAERYREVAERIVRFSHIDGHSLVVA